MQSQMTHRDQSCDQSQVSVQVVTYSNNQRDRSKHQLCAQSQPVATNRLIKHVCFHISFHIAVEEETSQCHLRREKAMVQSESNEYVQETAN